MQLKEQKRIPAMDDCFNNVMKESVTLGPLHLQSSVYALQI